MESKNIEYVQDPDPRKFPLLENIKNQLRRGYYGEVEQRIARLIPLSTRERLPLETVEKDLISVLQSVVRTLIGNFLPGNEIQEGQGSEYYDTILQSHVDKLTYCMIQASSNFTLGQLLFYIHEDFVYSYIRDTVVSPNLSAIYQDILEKHHKKEAIEKVEEAVEKCHIILDACITHFMLGLNLDSFLERIQEWRQLELEHKSQISEEYLRNYKYIVPQFLFRLFTLEEKDTNYGSILQECVQQATQFYEKYVVTHTEEGLLDLYRTITDNKTVLLKGELTLRDRNHYLGIVSYKRIDDLTVPQLKVLQSILGSKKLSEEDKKYISENAILTAISGLVHHHGGIDNVWEISNDSLICKRKGKVYTYNYRNDQAAETVTDPFYILGSKPKQYRDTLLEHPEKSCLTQTGMTTEDRKYYILQGIDPDKWNVTQKIQHRSSMIRKLTQQFLRDSEVSTELQRIRNMEWKHPKYLHANISRNYIQNDLRQLLFILVETDVLYQHLLSTLQHERN